MSESVDSNQPYNVHIGIVDNTRLKPKQARQPFQQIQYSRQKVTNYRGSIVDQ